MGKLLIVILLAIAIYWFVKKREHQRGQITDNALAKAAAPAAKSVPSAPKPGINRIPADALINSPYYKEYKNTFDLIWYNGKQPKYKIDWLLESLNMGRELEIDGLYVLDSMKKDLPYFCETEDEFDLFFNDKTPVLKGSVEAIADIAALYNDKLSKYFHPSKAKYWKEHLNALAAKGNLEAQGALCGLPGYRIFSPTEVGHFKEKYETALRELAKEGNSQAQLAVGLYLTPNTSQEAIDWLTKAASQGLGDAWYHLGNAYKSRTVRFEMVNGSLAQVVVPGAEIQKLMAACTECYYKAANADNGIMVGYCQYLTGDSYRDGDSIFPKDFEKAMYWFRRAADNGIRIARSAVERFTEDPERF